MTNHSEQKSSLERVRLSFGGSSSAARILNALTFALKRRENDRAASNSALPRPSPSSWRGRHTQRRAGESRD
jgi:hypothetical protein